MQRLPAFSAQTPNPSRSRRHRERNQQNERCEADCDELALRDINQHFVNIEKLVEPDVSQEMQAAVEKGVEPEHPAEFNERRNAKKFSQWRDGKRDQKKPQGPVAGRVSDLFDRIRTEILRVGVPSQKPNRHKARNEHHDFYKTNHS